MTLKKIIKEKDMIKMQQQILPKPDSTSRGILKSDSKSRGDIDDSEWKRLLEQKEQILLQREKTIEEYRQKLNVSIKILDSLSYFFQEKSNNEIKERQAHAVELHKIKEQYTDLESRYRALLSIHHPDSEKRKFGEAGRSSSKFDEDLPSDSRGERSMGYEGKYKKVKRLMFEDVSGLGYELSLKLRGRRIPLDDILVRE